MKNPWVIIGVFTVVLFGGAIILSNQSAKESNEGVEVLTHYKGNAEADVTLVEYSDFQCPACAAFYPVVKDVIDQYGDDIRFEYRHFPLSTIHPHAMTAAVAAEAAGQQGKFFEFHDLVFENQAEWSVLGVPTVAFVGYAEELNLDIEQFKRQMNSSILRDKVKSEFDEGRSKEITGTPTFFLNGERMQFESYQEFMDEITLAVDPSVLPVTEDRPTVESDVRFGI